MNAVTSVMGVNGVLTIVAPKQAQRATSYTREPSPYVARGLDDYTSYSRPTYRDLDYDLFGQATQRPSSHPFWGENDSHCLRDPTRGHATHGSCGCQCHNKGFHDSMNKTNIWRY